MQTGAIALIIILAVIVFAIITKKSAECIIIGSLAGCIVMYGTGFLTEWCTMLQTAVTDNVWILVVCGLFGSLIALLQASRGSMGFTRIVSKLCNTDRKTLLTTFVLGVVIFIDDYLNVLSIGACMKNVYDKRKLPRESLAYMLDSTGAPVCVLIPFSTWAVFYASLFFEQESVVALGFSSGFEAYIRAIPFSFYPIVALIIVLLFALGIMPKLGGMKKAYQRVEETGKVYSDVSRKFNQNELTGAEEGGNVWDFIIPMVILIAITIITSDLLVAVVVAIGVCAVMYIPRKVVPVNDFFNTIVKGFADMMPTLIILTIAFLLQAVLDQMALTDFIINIMEPLLTGAIFPMISFILMAALAFATASFWGMSAVVVPIVFPLGAAIGANPILIMAAIISGSSFGSHACFYCDATLLSSSAAGIDNMEHAISQLPYVLIGAGISAVLFLICGFVM